MPVQSSNGFDGLGIVVFVAAIAMLALLVLPYAMPSGRSELDRPLVYALLAGVALASLVIQVVQLWAANTLKVWPPDGSLGLWLVALGMALICWGVGALLGEKPPKPPLRSLRQ
jgi:hypothetical protein